MNKQKNMSFVFLLVFLFMGLMIAGCSNNSPSQNNASQNTNEEEVKEPIEIKFWTYPAGLTLEDSETGEPDEWIKVYAERFEEIHPEANIEVELLDWQGGTEKIDISVAAGSPPDLVYNINNFGGVSKYGEMGALEPIDPYLTEEDWSDFSEAVKGAMSYDGQAYLWPQLTLVSAIAVNMDLFEERNAVDLLPLDRPLRDWTFEEFLEAAKAVTFSRSGDDSRPDVYGASMWSTNAVFYQYLFGAANGGQILDNEFDEVVINSPEFREGIQFMIDLANKHKVSPPGAAGLTNSNIGDMFLNQQVAMLPATGSTSNLADEAPEPFEVEYVSPPHGIGKETKAWNNVGGYIVFKQEDKAKRDLVMEFARFVTNTENAKVVKSIGVFPARYSSGNLYGDNETMSYFNDLAAYGDSNFSRSFGLAIPAVWEQELQAMLTGEKTAEEALQSLENLIEQNLDE